MRNRCRLFTIAALSTLLVPATAMGQKVAYDYKRTADLSNIHTFAFKDVPSEDTTAERTTTYASPLVMERTRAAIASELQSRGLTMDPSRPDAYVTTRTAYRTEQIMYGGGWNWGWGWGYGWGYGPYYGGPWYTEEVTKGTLIIDLIDAKSGQLLWRGLKEGTMHPHKDPDDRSKKVQKTVSKIFEKFPERGAVATSGYDVPVPRDHEGDGR